MEDGIAAVRDAGWYRARYFLHVDEILQIKFRVSLPRAIEIDQSGKRTNYLTFC